MKVTGYELRVKDVRNNCYGLRVTSLEGLINDGFGLRVTSLEGLINDGFGLRVAGFKKK
jgi:hypothetical protein